MITAEPTAGRPRLVPGPAPRYLPMAAVAVATFGAFLAFLDSTVVNVAFPYPETSFRHSSIDAR